MKRRGVRATVRTCDDMFRVCVPDDIDLSAYEARSTVFDAEFPVADAINGQYASASSIKYHLATAAELIVEAFGARTFSLARIEQMAATVARGDGDAVFDAGRVRDVWRFLTPEGVWNLLDACCGNIMFDHVHDTSPAFREVIVRFLFNWVGSSLADVTHMMSGDAFTFELSDIIQTIVVLTCDREHAHLMMAGCAGRDSAHTAPSQPCAQCRKTRRYCANRDRCTSDDVACALTTSTEMDIVAFQSMMQAESTSDERRSARVDMVSETFERVYGGRVNMQCVTDEMETPPWLGPLTTAAASTDAESEAAVNVYRSFCVWYSAYALVCIKTLETLHVTVNRLVQLSAARLVLQCSGDDAGRGTRRKRCERAATRKRRALLEQERERGAERGAAAHRRVPADDAPSPTSECTTVDIISEQQERALDAEVNAFRARLLDASSACRGQTRLSTGALFSATTRNMFTGLAAPPARVRPSA